VIEDTLENLFVLSHSGQLHDLDCTDIITAT
jgi:hypothetical protein